MASLWDLNLPYYSVPAALALLMVPHGYAVFLAGKNYDLANPRRTESHCAKDTSLPKAKLNRISRAKAATANGFETISLYAAGIAAANVAGVSPERINNLAAAYLVSRAVYNYTYVVLQDNSRWAGLRSMAWAVGIVAILGLWVGAGNAVN